MSCNVDVKTFVSAPPAGGRSSLELMSLRAASSFAACGWKSACRSTVMRTFSIRRASSSMGLGSKTDGTGRRIASSRRAIWSCNVTIEAFVSLPSTGGRSSFELMSLRAASSFAACGRKSPCRSIVARTASIRRAKSSIGLGSKFADEDDRRNASSRRAVSSCSVDVRAFESAPPAAGGRSSFELISLRAASSFAACGRKSACRSNVVRTFSIRRASSSMGLGSKLTDGTGRRNASSRRAIWSCNVSIKAFASLPSTGGRSSFELMSPRAASSFAACGRKSPCRSIVARTASIRRARFLDRPRIEVRGRGRTSGRPLRGESSILATWTPRPSNRRRRRAGGPASN